MVAFELFETLKLFNLDPRRDNSSINPISVNTCLTLDFEFTTENSLISIVELKAFAFQLHWTNKPKSLCGYKMYYSTDVVVRKRMGLFSS